jgi:hypothetical protein
MYAGVAFVPVAGLLGRAIGARLAATDPAPARPGTVISLPQPAPAPAAEGAKAA